MSNIWFTSDLHFGHENVIKFCERPWDSVEAMNEGLIQKWNSRVREGDLVYVVGDFAFCNSTTREFILNRLHGTKILVQGNHDKGKVCPKGFSSMVSRLEIPIAGENVRVSHYPPRYTGLKQFWYKYILRRCPKYLDRMLPDDGGWFIHGHTHNPEQFNNRQIHVGVDAWNYYPVSISQISNYIQQYGGKAKKN